MDQSSVDPDQLDSPEASWSEPTLFCKEGIDFWKSNVHCVLIRSHLGFFYIGLDKQNIWA